MATERKAKAAPKKVAPAPIGAGAEGPSRNALQKRRVVVGTVVSDKMQKTIVVRVDRRVRHGLYGKYVVRSRKFKAHDETNSAKIGDQVACLESRPMSRDKRWVLKEIVRRAAQAGEANV